MITPGLKGQIPDTLERICDCRFLHSQSMQIWVRQQMYTWSRVYLDYWTCNSQKLFPTKGHLVSRTLFAKNGVPWGTDTSLNHWNEAKWSKMKYYKWLYFKSELTTESLYHFIGGCYGLCRRRLTGLWFLRDLHQHLDEQLQLRWKLRLWNEVCTL